MIPIRNRRTERGKRTDSTAESVVFLKIEKSVLDSHPSQSQAIGCLPTLSKLWSRISKCTAPLSFHDLNWGVCNC